MKRNLLHLAERGYLPDTLVRLGIRRLCARRLSQESAGGPEQQSARYLQRIEALRASPVALQPDAANAQHYELPQPFFRLCLGRHLKYSCCLYTRGDETLDEAEQAMLELYSARALLADGQSILELGCGWGSLTLWLAERYPGARITAVSNSSSQRRYIEDQCRQRELANVRVLTRDINELALAESQFDRCVSIEMFEHVRNYERLLARIARWLRPEGVLFVHLFAHRHLLYPFESAAEDDWMGKYFFTGGLMPASDTLLWFQQDLRLQQQWLLDGTHYQRTAEAWLANQDEHRDGVMAILESIHGAADARLWFQRWRMFWMACAELFGAAGGGEWMVAHYRFIKC